MAVGLVAALVAGLVWLNGARTYDELKPGGASTRGEARYAPGRETYVGLTVLNDGGRTVEVTRVGDRGGGMLVATSAKMGLHEGDAPPPRHQVVAFDRFELKPGHRRYVEVEYRMGGCLEWPPGASAVLRDVPVTYKTLFFEHTERLRLLTRVEIRRGQRDRCPR